MNLKKLFLNYCNEQNLEVNDNQMYIIDSINRFYQKNFNNSIISKLFLKKKNKQGFYLQGEVGIGKTMILDFFYKNFNQPKQRFHFNEFMIGFHNFTHLNKENKKINIIDKFVHKLKKKYKLIYFDEFQVTNIVDAMILGNLFKKIFHENIKVIFSSNIKIDNLYKDGLQRDQFLPFIKEMKNQCYQENLVIKDDYRKSKKNKNERYFFPINESTNFRINKLLRKLTKNKIKKEKILIIKGRKFKIENYYDGITKFDFHNLCNKNVGAEDYIKIAEVCNFIIIDNVPNFTDENSNQQQRFIILIDILYEKKIPLLIRSELDLNLIESAKALVGPFKRTISRLYELTSINYL